MALRCQNDYPVCGIKYDREKGLPEEGIEPGKRLEDIPDDWFCPRCREAAIPSETNDPKVEAPPVLRGV